MALTRTPLLPYLSANARESDSSAALVTEYAAFVLDGRFPDEEHTFTIRPHPRSAIAGAAVRIRRIGAITWSSHCSCHSASVSSSSGRTALVPALLTSASSRP